MTSQRGSNERSEKRASKGTLNVALVDALDDDSDSGDENASPLTSYLVDNTVLCHPGRGLGFRASPSTKDTIPDQLAEWGSIVVGRQYDDDWIKIGHRHPRYLPMKLQNVGVLKSQGPAQVTTSLSTGGKRNSNVQMSSLMPLQQGASNLGDDSFGPPAPAPSMAPGAFGSLSGLAAGLSGLTAQLETVGEPDMYIGTDGACAAPAQTANIPDKFDDSLAVDVAAAMRALNIDDDADGILFPDSGAKVEIANMTSGLEDDIEVKIARIRKLPKGPCVTKVFDDTLMDTADTTRALNMDDNEDDIPFLDSGAVVEMKNMTIEGDENDIEVEIANLRKLPKTPCVTRMFSDLLRDQVDDPEQELAHGARICILGSQILRGSANVSLVQAVAKGVRRAVGETAVIIMSGEAGVQATFAQAFGAESVVNFVPKGKKSVSGIGHDMVVGATITDVMTKMKSIAHLYLAFEGEASCVEISKAASERGAFVLPVMRTGGASSCADSPGFPAKALQRPSFVAEAVWSQIRDPSSGDEQVAALLSGIVGPFVAGINLMLNMAPPATPVPPTPQPEGVPDEAVPRTRHSLLGCEALDMLQLAGGKAADPEEEEDDPFDNLPTFVREKDSAALKAPSSTMMFSTNEHNNLLEGLTAELAMFEAQQEEEDPIVEAKAAAPEPTSADSAPPSPSSRKTVLTKDELRHSNTVMNKEIAELRVEIERRRVGASAA